MKYCVWANLSDAFCFAGVCVCVCVCVHPDSLLRLWPIGYKYHLLTCLLLRSASSTTLDIRRTTRTYDSELVSTYGALQMLLTYLLTHLSTVGDRTFPVAAAHLWSSLPSHVTAPPSLCPSSDVVLNHISSHFLIPLSDSSLICTVPAQ